MLLAGCEREAAPDQAHRPDPGPEVLAQNLVAAGQLGLRIQGRGRIPVGQPVWLALEPFAPSDPAVVADWWLETQAVVVRLDGRELPPRPWRVRQQLLDSNRRRFDLAVWTGAAGSQPGEHSLEALFQARLLAPDGSRQLWTGQLPAGRYDYALVRARAEELLPGIAAPQPDPAGLLELSLHLGGKRLVVYPGPAGPLELRLKDLPAHAMLFARASSPLPVGLAFEVQVASKATGGQWRRVGSAGAAAEELGGSPLAIGSLDLSGVAGLNQAGWSWRLVPSREVAWQHAGLDAFWERSLVLPQIQIHPVVPLPE